MRRIAIPGTLVAALLVACSGSNGTAHHPRSVQVQMTGFAFSPATIDVAVGDTVTFQNRDIVPHNVTAGTTFNSDSVKPGSDWHWVADRKGHFDYICAYHPTMKGTIVVE